MLKSLMFRAFAYGISLICLSTLIVSFAGAQISPRNAPHDFMIDNTPLDAKQLRAAFKGKTHLGYYRFERDEISTTKFTETTTSDGRVTHVQGDETLTGTWNIKADQICYQYADVWRNQYCFDIYRVGNCYYHYIRTSNGHPVNRWTARSTPKGEVPDCDIPIV